MQLSLWNIAHPLCPINNILSSDSPKLVLIAELHNQYKLGFSFFAHLKGDCEMQTLYIAVP